MKLTQYFWIITFFIGYANMPLSIASRNVVPRLDTIRYLARDVVINPLTFGFLSHRVFGKDFYKACILHFLLKPRETVLLTTVKSNIRRETLCYFAGAATSSLLDTTYTLIKDICRSIARYFNNADKLV